MGKEVNGTKKMKTGLKNMNQQTSNMKQTPLQELIEKLNSALRVTSENCGEGIKVALSLIKLNNSLEKEKQSHKEAFEAENNATDTSDFPMGSNKKDYPDFDEYYKQFEQP